MDEEIIAIYKSFPPYIQKQVIRLFELLFPEKYNDQCPE